MELDQITVAEYVDSLVSRIGFNANRLSLMAQAGCPDVDELLDAAGLIGSLASIVEQLRRPYSLEAE